MDRAICHEKLAPADAELCRACLMRVVLRDVVPSTALFVPMPPLPVQNAPSSNTVN